MSNPALTEAVYYILLSLIEPLHGYGIMQNVEQLSNGRVRLAAGTINLLITALGMIGLIHLFLKRKKLNLEQQIFE